jgi:type IV secretory pathway ATPase VirB11/archaellum biosynthesis ATPase
MTATVEQPVKTWDDRSQYGDIVRSLIENQKSLYDKEEEITKKTKISQSIAYLIQVQSKLITDEKNIEGRISELEKVAGITKKHGEGRR